MTMQHKAAVTTPSRWQLDPHHTRVGFSVKHMSERRFAFWLVMNGESPEQIQQELSAFPLYPYMKTELTPLAETNLTPQ